MRGVNLIPIHRREAARLRRRLRLWVGAWVAGVAAVVVIAVGVRSSQPSQPGVSSGDLVRAQARVEDLTQLIFDTNGTLLEAKARLAAGRVLSDRPDWSTLLMTIGKLLGSDNVLSAFKLAAVAPTTADAPATNPQAGAKIGGADQPPALPARYKIELSGKGRTQASVAQFVLRMQETKLFEEVKFVRSAREPFLHSEAIGFSIECTLSERARP
ncbi:MAG: PilN domain-containing protein [Planctomycetes bacterium]|nr:PilN domain-containing protein [Planctomycetota bacterium]